MINHCFTLFILIFCHKRPLFTLSILDNRQETGLLSGYLPPGNRRLGGLEGLLTPSSNRYSSSSSRLMGKCSPRSGPGGPDLGGISHSPLFVVVARSTRRFLWRETSTRICRYRQIHYSRLHLWDSGGIPKML